MEWYGYLYDEICRMDRDMQLIARRRAIGGCGKYRQSAVKNRGQPRLLLHPLVVDRCPVVAMDSDEQVSLCLEGHVQELKRTCIRPESLQLFAHGRVAVPEALKHSTSSSNMFRVFCILHLHQEPWGSRYIMHATLL